MCWGFIAISSSASSSVKFGSRADTSLLISDTSNCVGTSSPLTGFSIYLSLFSLKVSFLSSYKSMLQLVVMSVFWIPFLLNSTLAIFLKIPNLNLSLNVSTESWCLNGTPNWWSLVRILAIEYFFEFNIEINVITNWFSFRLCTMSKCFFEAL